MTENREEKKEAPAVSVIVPVREPGSALLRCMRSLRAQTLADVELIIVDDRGKDRSLGAVYSSMKEDPGIRVVRSPRNLGPGGARNLGIEAARGRYLAFVDADDCVSRDFLELLYKKAEAAGADIVKGNLVLRTNGKGRSRFRKSGLNREIRRGLASGLPLYAVFRYEHVSAIYRRTLFTERGVRYGTARAGEDSVFLLRAAHASSVFLTEDKALYFYCGRPEAARSYISGRSLRERLISLREQVDYLTEHMEDGETEPVWLFRRLDYCLELADAVGRAQEKRRVRTAGNGRMTCSPGPEEVRRDDVRMNPGSEADMDAGAFLEEIRGEMLRVPGIRRYARDHAGLRALLSYGVSLGIRPYQLPWERAGAADWFHLAGTWAGFLRDHPGEAPSYIACAARQAAQRLREKYGGWQWRRF